MNLVRISATRTFRLVPTAYHKPPVLEGLVSSYGARTALEELESVTSTRLKAQQGGVPTIDARTLQAGYGYTYINAAFAYRRAEGNRFNPPEWGAWYAAIELETALQEVGFHLARQLEAINYFDNETTYQELLADFDVELLDLRPERDLDCLNPDPAIGYPAGQKLAAEAREKGLNGVVYPSVRRMGGTCLVAFWPGLIRNFQQGGRWCFRWQGSRTPEIIQV